jgi:hypothetical protein
MTMLPQGSSGALVLLTDSVAVADVAAEPHAEASITTTMDTTNKKRVFISLLLFYNDS